MNTKGTRVISICVSFKEGDVSVVHSELGEDVHSSLVTFALEITSDPPPDPYKLVFLAQSTEPTEPKVSHVLYKVFSCSHFQSLLCLLCSSDLCTLYCTRRIELSLGIRSQGIPQKSL